MIVSISKHCDEQQLQKNTVMCTLHDFLTGKVRFICTRASFSLKKTTLTPRVHIVSPAVTASKNIVVIATQLQAAGNTHLNQFFVT